MTQAHKNTLSTLENKVMAVVWQQGQVTAEAVRSQLEPTQAMKDSTVRTILRRLEEKGYAQHTVDGRTFVYSPAVKSQSVAAEAVENIIENFCDGSIENLLVGMVEREVISPDKLRMLAHKISQAQKEK